MLSAELLLPLLVAGGFGAAGLILAIAWRPVIGGVAICLVVPLTAGLNLGSLGNFLKPDQIIVLLAFAGVALRELLTGRRLRYCLLDVAVVIFCLSELLIPFFVLYVAGHKLDLTTLHTIALPAQYGVVYLFFARSSTQPARLRLYCNLAMAACAAVALIGLLEFIDVPFARSLVALAYQTPPQPRWDPTYRPGSTVIHFSGLAAVSLLGYTLALSLAASRVEGLSQWWLGAVMGSSLLGLLASLTYAPFVLLPAVTAIVCLRLRCIPRALWVVGAGAAASGIALWPLLSQRLAEQLGNGGSLLMPQSLAVRLGYWQEFFYPALVQHGLWLGTATQLPGEVPAYLAQYIDNNYLDQAFRAGVVGVALSLALYAAIGITAWKVTGAPERIHRAIGAAVLATILALLALDVTSEYLTFAAFLQLFWMLVGLVGAIARPAIPERAIVLAAPRRSLWPHTGTPVLATALSSRRATPALRAPAPKAGLVPAALATANQAHGAGTPGPAHQRPGPRPAVWRALRGLLPLAGASATVFSGFAAARLLGFVFSVVAARILLPTAFGQFSYVLAAAAIASMMVTSAPVGLSGYLARHHDDPGIQREYGSAWLFVLGAVLLASLIVTAAAAPLLGIDRWLLVGLLTNVLGPAVLAAYVEIQRGLGRNVRGVGFYVAANLLQLLVLLFLWRAHLASVPLVLGVYGLSTVAVLPLFMLLRPAGIRPALRSFRWDRVREVVRFARTLLAQSVFYNIWLSADVVLVGRLLGRDMVGYYGAAKTLSNVLLLAPAALGFVILPRIATAARETRATQLWQALGLAALAAVPTVGGVAIVSRFAVRVLFGPAYAPAAMPLVILGAGFGVYCLYSVLSNACIGLGRPGFVAFASIAAAAGSVAGSLLLVPRLGIVGGALGFTTGSILQFIVLSALAFHAGILSRPRSLPAPAEPMTGALDP